MHELVGVTDEKKGKKGKKRWAVYSPWKIPGTERKNDWRFGFLQSNRVKK